MTIRDDPRAAVPEPGPARGDRPARRRLTGHGVPLGFAVSVALLAALLAAAVLIPWLSDTDPLRQVVEHRLEGPSAAHWLGTDETGRDVTLRLVWGARPALWGVVITLAVAVVIGVPWGLVSGYAGGVVDEVLMRIADAILSFPGIVLSIAITGALGPTLVNAMASVGVVFSPVLARLMRSSTLPQRHAEFVLVARALGASRLRVAVRHVLPNAMAPVLVQLCALASLALLIETSLAFLGLGVQPPAPSWGGDLALAYQSFTITPVATIAPGATVVAAAFLLSRVGDGLRDLLRTN